MKKQATDDIEHVPLKDALRLKRRARPALHAYVVRNLEKLRQRKLTSGCDQCGYRGLGIRFVQPDGSRPCSRDAYSSETKFLKKFAAATALCLNCYEDKFPKTKSVRVVYRKVEVTPQLNRLLTDFPALAKHFMDAEPHVPSAPKAVRLEGLNAVAAFEAEKAERAAAKARREAHAVVDVGSPETPDEVSDEFAALLGGDDAGETPDQAEDAPAEEAPEAACEASEEVPATAAGLAALISKSVDDAARRQA